MPTKRKFTARFPTAKIKRIMQVDEEVGKISATVPSVVSCALEVCIGQLVTKAYELALSRNSRTVTPSHLKQVIEETAEFQFAHELVRNVAVLKPIKSQSSVDTNGGEFCLFSNSDVVRGDRVIDSIKHDDDEDEGILTSSIGSCVEFGTVTKKRGRPKKSVINSTIISHSNIVTNNNHCKQPQQKGNQQSDRFFSQRKRTRRKSPHQSSMVVVDSTTNHSSSTATTTTDRGSDSQ